MPVKLSSSGINNELDLPKEVIAPMDSGYYLEAMAKLDAYIDSLLDSLVRQVYSDQNSQKMLDSIEKSMKKEYTYVSGLVKLEILKSSEQSPSSKINTPDKDLIKKIKKFKEKRNKALHSPLGHYQLAANYDESNLSFQVSAKTEAEDAIQLGIECFTKLTNLLQDNSEKDTKK